MTGTQYTLNSEFDFSLIALSAFLAVFVAYACIEFTRCIVLAPEKKRKRWIISGAIMLGIGLWAAQLASMNSLRLPVEINYLLRPIMLSLLLAILSAAAILNINIQQNLSRPRWIFVSISIGVLMTAMNLMGLQAIQVSAHITQHAGPILLSTLVMILATTLVSKQAFELRNNKPEASLHIHFIAILVGVSVVSSYLLGIHTLTFITAAPITNENPDNNIFAYQILLVSAFAAFLLWGGILFSRWQASEGVKISSQIAGLAFGLVLATAGTISAVAFTASKQELTRQQLVSHLNKLDLEAIQLQSIINGLLQDALVLAHTPPILGIMRAQQNNGIDKQDGSSEIVWHNRLTAIFNGFLLSKPAYLRAGYIGAAKNGAEIVSVTRSGASLLSAPNKTLTKAVKEVIFKRAKVKENYQAFLSNITQSDAGQAVLYASVPIRDAQEKLFGIIVIKLDLFLVLNTTLQKMDAAHYMANPEGHIIFGKNKDQVLPTAPIRNTDIKDIYPVLRKIIDNSDKISGNISFNENNEHLFLNYRKIKLDPEQNEYYLRVTSTPYKNISNHVLPVLTKFSTVVLILIGLSAALASFLSRLITKPLKQMTLATQQFANGETTKLPASAGGEFGILARAFEDMINKVDERGKAIIQSEAFVRNIVDSAADGLITVDESGIVISFNLSAQAIFGYSEKEVIGNNITMLMPQRFRTTHGEKLKKYMATPVGKEKILRVNVIGLRKNKEEFPIEFSVSRASSTQSPLFIGIIRDTTISEKSAVNMRLMNKVLKSTPEGIVITDANGIIVRTNPAFEEITGFSEDEAIGKTPSLLKSGRHNADFFKHMWRSIVEQGIWQGEIWDKRKNGDIYPKWLNISTIKNDEQVTTHYVGLFSDITERKEVEKKLERLAHYDALTGLPNRALFHDRLLHSLEFARRSDKGLAVMMLDLDRFKVINDTLGHDIGDLLLVEAAKCLQKCLRKVDTVARMGGDEFIIILSDLTDTNDAIQLAKVIINALSKPFSLSGHECFVGVSIGISSYPDDGNNPKTLAKNADTAMYRAKEMGRNTYQLFNADMSRRNTERLELETKLRSALRNNELDLYYQPQIDLCSGQISGMEALLRWQHHELGMIPPSVFIPIAEDSGLISEIGLWILHTISQQYKSWAEAGLSSMSIMLNLSAQQVFQSRLVDELHELLDASNMPAEKLILEISESALLDLPPHAINTLEKLSALGVQLAIDDFGTSYSSMGQLKNMPIQIIKIDQSFIQNISNGSNSEEIIKAIIAMARNLHLRVVAEGVETMEQLAFLKLQGCDAMQGYLYGPPLPLTAISQMLKNGISPLLFGSPIPDKP